MTTNASFEGVLTTPGAKEKPGDKVRLRGHSKIDYTERLLPVDPKEADHKVVRVYERIEFQKVIGDRTDETTLRPAVKRVVVLKQGAKKAPFSPDGPLLWGEIELLSRETIIPALAGLLPDKPVKPGDTWTASAAALAELTDLEKVDAGSLEVKLERVIENGPRRIADLTLAARLTGINEDGPTRQKVTGKLQVDLKGGFISLLTLDGEQVLLDETGAEAGVVKIRFELFREPSAGHAGIKDEALKGLELTPTAENTALLYESDETGVRFVHPRNWRVVRTAGRQITLDVTGGAGVLVTLDAAGAGPTAAQFLQETIKALAERNGKLLGQAGPEKLAAGVERFTLEAEEGPDKDKV
ncbi:MAG TPA: hypothetical protein VM597_38390, partial [Gemmataceae bacterium]|nr:hypothetical protein [Gemmataceae bacterium]